ncbi:MAG TPA: beta-ketoacyl synthase chain length factor [Steroidobacteraceae bacterium]|nr:beta-ketoacyl synthase chain length factor [Steroidobacteraceae bacterium]
MSVHGYLRSIGVVGPGIDDWSQARSVLTAQSPYRFRPTSLPAPEGLPPAERRRVGRVVKLALAAGLQAAKGAGLDPATLPAVFSSSGGDGQNCHELCEVLATPDPHLSPTRFHNSVHNAAAGYWSIATGARTPSNALCAFDASFAAGLLEALTQVVVDQVPVLLVAYDAPYPPPLDAKRPIAEAFGVAMVLAPRGDSSSLAQLTLSFADAAPSGLGDSDLEHLRTSIPAARCLPLLRQIALGAPGEVVLEYLAPHHLGVSVA